MTITDRNLLEGVDVDGLELTESDEVSANEDAELPPLLLPLLPVTRVTLVLHAHPQLVHLGKVQVDEVDRVPHRSRVSLTTAGTNMMR